MDEHDSVLTPGDIEVLRLLEFLYDNGGKDSARHLQGFDYPREKLRALLAAADDADLVTLVPHIRRGGMVGDPARLRVAGVRHVEQVRSARATAVTRKRACRNALLRWTYNSGSRTVDPSAMPVGNPDYQFFGESFTAADISDAAKFLVGAGLFGEPGRMNAKGDLYLATITADGIRCVEDFDADVRNFNNQGVAGRGSNVTTHNVINNQNVYGDNHGQLAQGGHVQQAQTGLVGADLEQLLAPLVEALQQVDNDDDRADLGDAVDQLRDAVTADQPDAELIQKRAGFLERQAARVGNAAFAAAASETVKRIVDLLLGAS